MEAFVQIRKKVYEANASQNVMSYSPAYGYIIALMLLIVVKLL